MTSLATHVYNSLEVTARYTSFPAQHHGRPASSMVALSMKGGGILTLVLLVSSICSQRVLCSVCRAVPCGAAHFVFVFAGRSADASADLQTRSG